MTCLIRVICLDPISLKSALADSLSLLGDTVCLQSWCGTWCHKYAVSQSQCRVSIKSFGEVTNACETEE